MTKFISMQHEVPWFHFHSMIYRITYTPPHLSHPPAWAELTSDILKEKKVSHWSGRINSEALAAQAAVVRTPGVATGFVSYYVAIITEAAYSLIAVLSCWGFTVPLKSENNGLYLLNTYNKLFTYIISYYSSNNCTW